MIDVPKKRGRKKKPPRKVDEFILSPGTLPPKIDGTEESVRVRFFIENDVYHYGYYDYSLRSYVAFFGKKNRVGRRKISETEFKGWIQI